MCPPISSFLRGLEFLKCLLDVGDERRSSDLYNAPIGVDAVAERALEDAVTDNEEYLEVQEIGLGWNGTERNEELVDPLGDRALIAMGLSDDAR